MALWYHFAIMFEALFILTTLDAGTRVGRFMLQDLGRHVWAPFGRVSWYPAVLLSSAIFVVMWGYFLYQGVHRSRSAASTRSGRCSASRISCSAAVALCVGTTVIIKMGKARYAWVTILPLVWLVIVTMTAGWQKMFSPDPQLGFLSHARSLGAAIDAGALPAGVATVSAAHQMMFNDYLDAAVAAFFMISVIVILADSLRTWSAVISGRESALSSEVPFEPRVAPEAP